MNPLEMLGLRWLSIHRFLPKSCLFQRLPPVCFFCSVIMSSSSLYFQSSRSPTLRSSCAHSTTAACCALSTTAACSVRGRNRKYVSLFTCISLQYLFKQLVSLFYLSSPCQIVDSRWHFPGFQKCVYSMDPQAPAPDCDELTSLSVDYS